MESQSVWHFIFMMILSQQGISGDEIRLDQSPAVIKRPGETVKISCKTSGFTMTNYFMHWIRQKPGKGLEWIVIVDSGSSSSSNYIIYADSMKNHFTMSEDVSQSTQYLEAKSLREEDTAVYYCARGRLGTAFDYWGKGTQVIVTNEVVKAPDVFMMSPCESSPGSLIVGCLATGFSPTESVRFKWMDQRGNALTDFIQYPTVGTKDKLLKVSHITINETKWNQSKITCEAGHPAGNVNETFTTVKPQTPTLSLTLVTTPKSKSVMCVIEDFYPKKIDVQWMVNNIKSMTQPKLESKQNENTGYYRAYSFYEVSRETWDANTFYTCEVTHRGKTFNTKANFKAKFTLTLKPPIQREIFLNDRVVLEAVVSGDVEKTVQDASLSCKVKDVPVTFENIKPGNTHFSNDISQFIRTHNVVIETKKWFDGEMVTCTIRDTNNNRDVKQEIRFDKGDGKKPNVTIYKLDEVMDRGPVSYVCEVSSPKLGDVYMMWKLGKDSHESRTSSPIHQNNSVSVLSILKLTKEEYEKLSTTITCAVIHANMNNRSSPLQKSTSQSKQPELSCE